MKALTVWQPWAWAIMEGFKRLENRKWFPKPGQLKTGDLLAIHSGRKMDWEGLRFLRGYCEGSGVVVPDKLGFPMGYVVGICRYTGVVTESDEPLFCGPYGWKLEVVRKLVPPVAARGNLGLWDWDEGAGC